MHGDLAVGLLPREVNYRDKLKLFAPVNSLSFMACMVGWGDEFRNGRMEETYALRYQELAVNQTSTEEILIGYSPTSCPCLVSYIFYVP